MRKRIALAICAILLFSGCGQKTVDYNLDLNNSSENSTISSENTVVDSTSTQTSEITVPSNSKDKILDVDKWEERLDLTDDSLSVKSFSVNCEIIVPDSDMFLIMAKEIEFDESYKEEICKKLFGSATLYAHDDAHMTADEIQSDISIIKEELEYLRTEIDNTKDNPNLAEEYLNYLEANFTDRTDRLAELEAAYENAGDTLPISTSFANSGYQAVIDGSTYEVSFFDTQNDKKNYYYSNRTFRSKELCYETLDNKMILPASAADSITSDYNVNYTYLSSVGNLSENDISNTASISADDAKQQADLFLNKLGYSYLEYINTESLYINAYNETDNYEAINGYVIHYDLDSSPIFSRIKNESAASFSLYTGDGLDNNYDGKIHYVTNTVASIYVNDNGIVKAVINNPVDIVERIDSVSVLPASSAISIIKNELLTNPLEHTSGAYPVVRLSSLELRLFRICGETDHDYAYIPVWIASNVVVKNSTEDNPESYSDYCIINAIDGNVINVFRDTYR